MLEYGNRSPRQGDIWHTADIRKMKCVDGGRALAEHVAVTNGWEVITRKA